MAADNTTTRHEPAFTEEEMRRADTDPAWLRWARRVVTLANDTNTPPKLARQAVEQADLESGQ
jgi:hypothetical protein